ncbi:hypothetical protein [Nonomuraea sp. NPDC049158]|uniref:hypothetical protein n=1 Tax=Nonomuraea sp. NPDC049158 TaxID=3155649 RepID=UPI0033D52B20
MLRKAGRREFGERHDGFVVEGGDDAAPFLIACTEEAEGPRRSSRGIGSIW